MSQETAGEVVFCGATDFDTIWSGTRNEKYNDIVRPSRINVLMGKKVSLIASGPSAAHSVIVAEDGCYTFGFNKWGQLGHGDGGWPTQIRVPTRIPIREVVVGASCGKTHTWLLTNSGKIFAMGGNEHGQLGCGHKKPLKDPTLVTGIPGVERVAVGQDFSVLLSDTGTVMACGKPEYGQLGNNTTGEFFVTASKLEFQCETRPIVVEKLPSNVVDIKCGNHHTIAMTEDGRVYSWGFGGYGRLGHDNPADLLEPKELLTFSEPVRPRAGAAPGPPDSAVGITCGAACSMVIRKSGVTNFWGKTKTSGEATMYPKPIADLHGWRVRAFGSGNTSIVIAAEKSVISWGPSPTRGELGYGKGEKTSSTKPKKMDPMEGYNVAQIACTCIAPRSRACRVWRRGG